MTTSHIRPYGMLWRQTIDLPEQFRAARLKDAPDSPARDVAYKYLKDFWRTASNGIAPLFLGSARTWKTHCAAAIARMVHEQLNIAVEFAEAPTLRHTLEALRFEDSTQKYTRRLLEVTLLVVDDFTVIKPDGYVGSFLQTLCHNRFSRKLPTIWTGNVTLHEGAEFEELARLYGPMMARRLEDGSRGFAAFTD